MRHFSLTESNSSLQTLRFKTLQDYLQLEKKEQKSAAIVETTKLKRPKTKIY